MRTREFHSATKVAEVGRPPSPTVAIDHRLTDAIVLAVVLFVTATAWCLANSKWGPADWKYPTTYVDPVYSDFIGTCGPIKARSEGHLTPFAWKTIPDLAAPDGAAWNVGPTPDEPLILLFGALARTCGLFSGFNLGVLLGHLAAAATFYLVARRWLGAHPVWAFVGALAFGLAPYLFAESPHHVACQYAWHLPLFPLVWTWVATDPGLQWRSRRLWQAVAIAVVTGLQNPYYTYVFCQLTLLGGAVFAYRHRSWKALAPALVVVGAAAAAFFLSELDTLTYRSAHPAAVSGPLVAAREYRWMDIYGFKVIDMFIPSFNHHSDTLAGFGLAHRQASVLNDEDGCAYLGLLGIGCLLWLVAASTRALLDRKLPAVPLQAWWLLWIVLFFNTGGLNSMIAAFTGFTLFRTATRYSVVVLAVVLLYVAERLSAWQRNAASRHPADTLRTGMITAAIAACLLVLWDQVPRGPTFEKTSLIRKVVESDREFVGKLESALPDKALVFQLPVMDGTPIAGVPSSDHYRPYLYGNRLRWTHGAQPGTKTLQWQQSVQQKLVEGASVDQQAQQVRFVADNVRRAVDEMRGKGFAAIYVNRNGFPDRGKGLFDALLDLGYETPPIYSPAGDLACILLDNQPTAAK
jgi:hypothetical protein